MDGVDGPQTIASAGDCRSAPRFGRHAGRNHVCGGEMKPELAPVKALVFDVFGTVVDWRGSIAREVRELAREKSLRVNAVKFADAWRGGYRPAMDRVASGELPWTR